VTKESEKQIQKLTARIIDLRAKGKERATDAANKAEARVNAKTADKVATLEAMIAGLKAAK
jgi:hypothetical protein